MILSWRLKPMIYMVNNKSVSDEFYNKQFKRPVMGLTFIGFTLIVCLAFLIYFGAWVADKRLELRNQQEPIWWENTILWVCPLH